MYKRQSLNAETQAAATAVDVLEFCHSFINLMYEPHLVLKTAAFQTKRPSSLVVDAKSLYDSLKKEAPVQGSSDRRTAIEQIGLKQSLRSVGANVRWVSSERQMADGLTKISARQLFADRLSKQCYRLVFDATYTAAKKKIEQRKLSERENCYVVHDITDAMSNTKFCNHVFAQETLASSAQAERYLGVSQQIFPCAVIEGKAKSPFSPVREQPAAVPSAVVAASSQSAVGAAGTGSAVGAALLTEETAQTWMLSLIHI